MWTKTGTCKASHRHRRLHYAFSKLDVISSLSRHYSRHVGASPSTSTTLIRHVDQYFSDYFIDYRFSDYSEFYLGGGGCYAALMRPNKVETRLQLQKNGLVKAQKLVGRLAIGWVKRVFMVWSCYFPAE